jgi:hypothetical protein
MLISESATDTIVVYLILKKLIKPWKEWDAYKVGLIDEKGKKLKKPATQEERRAWTVLDRFIANFKRVLEKFVGGSKLGTILSAAFLLKESYSTLLKQSGINEDKLCEDWSHSDNLELWKLEQALNITEKNIWFGDDTHAFEYRLDKYSKQMDEILAESNNLIVERFDV